MDNRHLYRGKRLDNGEWETGTLAIERMHTSEEKYFIVDKMTGYHSPIDPATAGQCTGLTAAKSYRGAEEGNLLIFQKDVVREKGGVIYHIDYLKQTTVARKIGTVSRFKWIEELITDNIEIVGNSIDNPELLEVDGE